MSSEQQQHLHLSPSSSLFVQEGVYSTPPSIREFLREKKGNLSTHHQIHQDEEQEAIATHHVEQDEENNDEYFVDENEFVPEEENNNDYYISNKNVDEAADAVEFDNQQEFSEYRNEHADEINALVQEFATNSIDDENNNGGNDEVEVEEHEEDTSHQNGEIEGENPDGESSKQNTTNNHVIDEAELEEPLVFSVSPDDKTHHPYIFESEERLERFLKTKKCLEQRNIFLRDRPGTVFTEEESVIAEEAEIRKTILAEEQEEHEIDEHLQLESMQRIWQIEEEEIRKRQNDEAFNVVIDENELQPGELIKKYVPIGESDQDDDDENSDTSRQTTHPYYDLYPENFQEFAYQSDSPTGNWIAKDELERTKQLSKEREKREKEELKLQQEEEQRLIEQQRNEPPSIPRCQSPFLLHSPPPRQQLRSLPQFSNLPSESPSSIVNSYSPSVEEAAAFFRNRKNVNNTDHYDHNQYIHDPNTTTWKNVMKHDDHRLLQQQEKQQQGQKLPQTRNQSDETATTNPLMVMQKQQQQQLPHHHHHHRQTSSLPAAASTTSSPNGQKKREPLVSFVPTDEDERRKQKRDFYGLLPTVTQIPDAADNVSPSPRSMRRTKSRKGNNNGGGMNMDTSSHHYISPSSAAAASMYEQEEQKKQQPLPPSYPQYFRPPPPPVSQSYSASRYFQLSLIGLNDNFTDNHHHEDTSMMNTTKDGTKNPFLPAPVQRPPHVQQMISSQVQQLVAAEHERQHGHRDSPVSSSVSRKRRQQNR